jgi:tellurite resistance protein TehA-like permease
MKYLPYVVCIVCAAISAIAAGNLSNPSSMSSDGRAMATAAMVFFGLTSLALPVIMAIINCKEQR